MEYLAIQEQEGVESLVLSAGRHLLVDRQIAEKMVDLGTSHIRRTSIMVKSDKSTDPLEVCSFRFRRVVLYSQGCRHCFFHSAHIHAR